MDEDLEKGVGSSAAQFTLVHSPNSSAGTEKSWGSETLTSAMKSSLGYLSSAVDQLEDSDQPPAAESTTDKASFWRRLWQRPSRPPKREDDPCRRLQVTPVHGGPLGYPLMARFMDSDDNYMTYRRFGNVQARLLLEAQDDVRILEEKLEDLDDEETANKGEANALCSRKLYGANWSETRRDLMKSLKAAFNEYATLMGSAQTLMSLNRPTSHEYTSVENFMNNEKPVPRPQFSFIYRKEDLVTLRPGREHAWLDSQVEKLLKACDGRLVQKIFSSSESKQKKGSETAVEVYFDRERTETFVNAIITCMILALLILPVYILYRITAGPSAYNTNALCMGVLLIFTLCFSAGLSFFTRAQRHEILAAAAGYAAVLVVFIGNVSGRGGFGSN